MSRKVKTLKDLTHKQRQRLRARQYSKLMEVEIPDRLADLVVPGMWYIIWEKNLLKPQVLKYPFRGEYFAQTYADKKLKNYKYNILDGETLINYGFNRAMKSLKELTDNPRGEIKYQFPEELSQQRKKTLRTMYRRNLRRLLIKLMSNESK